MKIARTYPAALAVWIILGLCAPRLGAQQRQRPEKKPPAAATTRSAGPARVGVCDVVSVFDRYQRARDETAKLEQAGQRTKQDDRNRRKAIEQAKAAMAGVQGDPERREALAEKVKTLQTEHKAWQERQQARYMRYHHRLTREMYDEILAVVADVARERGFYLVVQTHREKMTSENTPDLIRKIHARAVLFAVPEIDITDVVLRRLNAAYAKSKSARPATGPASRPGKSPGEDL